MNNKKIIIVTPKFPWPNTGACEQERLQGIVDFIRYGYEVTVISKVHAYQNKKDIYSFAEKIGIKLFLVDYRIISNNRIKKVFIILKRFFSFIYWDGATFEYTDKNISQVFKKQIQHNKPNLVWFDYTYLWPLYKIAKKAHIKIVTRSINFEARHFLEEDGYNLLNLIKFIPKLINEYITIKKTNIMFSITPKEMLMYRKMQPSIEISNLPLRSLPGLLVNDRGIIDKKVVDVFFMGASYNVVHNRAALELVIKDIAPQLNKEMPGIFKIHILGSKLPNEYTQYFNENVIYDGYVDNLSNFLDNMDIALIPSLYGAGMQQKIFEPLVRGIPTISSTRGLAGYPFKNNEHILLADDIIDFVEALKKMRDIDTRRRLSCNAINLSQQLFSKQKIDSIIKENIIKLNIV
jgi:hypothetical protein